MNRGAAHAPRSEDRIMLFEDYGCVKVMGGQRPFRNVLVYIHAGYSSERRFERYARELKAGQMTRLQAHHSYVFGAQEVMGDEKWRICKTACTGKISREMFCCLLDLFKLWGYEDRNQTGSNSDDPSVS